MSRENENNIEFNLFKIFVYMSDIYVHSAGINLARKNMF